MKPLLGLILFLPCALHAVLPLPYSTDPPVEDESPGEVVTVDPKTIPGYSELFSHSQVRAMELPDFGADSTFTVPEGLRHRVDFWKKVYTVYTRSQAVLHDAENLDMVYEVLDLSAYTENAKLDAKARRRAIGKALKATRKRLSDGLKLLHAKQRNPRGIPLALFPLFRKFESNKDPEKFLKASKNVRAQVGQRDRIVQGFLFGGRYWNKMMEIFTQRGVPRELTRLPLVESGFDLSARSKVGASGVWQFMRSTGKRYLRIDRGIDERNDPINAAWAAAELLRQNYETLEEWPLAVTAYNHGREGMARAVRKVESRDLVEIIKKYDGASFGFASANFYSEFLAILEIERDYRKYFGTLMVDAPIEYATVASPRPIAFPQLAERCGLKTEDLASLNPSFTPLTLSGRALIPARYAVKVPIGSQKACGRVTDYQNGEDNA